MASANNEIELATSNADSDTESIESGLQKSSYDPEEPKLVKDEDEDGGHKWMNLVLLPLLLLFLAMQCSFLLSQYIIEGDQGMLASVSLVGSMTLGIVAMVTLFQQIWAGKVHLRDNTRQNVQVNAILRDNLSLVGIVFFCPFACLRNMFELFTEVICGKSWKMTDEYPFYITEIAFSVLHTTFMILELLFCVQFRRLLLKKNVSNIRRFCVKLSLTFVVAANIGLWFNVILNETIISDTAWSSALGNASVHSYKSCLGSTFNSMEETVRRALYPFSIEFSLLFLEFIASHLIFKRPHNDHDIEVDQYVTPSSESLSDSSCRASLKSISGDDKSFFFGVTSPLVIIFGVFTNLMSITLAFFSRVDIFGPDILQATVIYNQHFMIFYWLLIILLMTIGFVSACKFKAGKTKLKGIDYVVMVSSFGPFILFLIRIIVIIENREEVSKIYEPVIIWLPEVLNLIEVVLQLPFMFFADGIQSPSEEEGRKPRWRIFKAAVLSVALCNITLWLLDSILLDLDIVATLFKESHWTILDGIFRPFAIFFRFNSFLILLRAFLC